MKVKSIVTADGKFSKNFIKRNIQVFFHFSCSGVTNTISIISDHIIKLLLDDHN